MSVKFSVCLIAKNEAPNLWRLHNPFPSSYTRGGEVVLLDTGTTDDTVGVARDLGFRVLEVGEQFSSTFPISLPTASTNNSSWRVRNR